MAIDIIITYTISPFTSKMFGGVKFVGSISKECDALDISFHLLIGFAKDAVPKFVKDHSIAGVVTDFSPLRTPTQWVNDVKDSLPHTVPMFQVCYYFDCVQMRQFSNLLSATQSNMLKYIYRVFGFQKYQYV